MTTAPAHSASLVPARGPQRQAGTGAPILGRMVAGVASPQPLAPVFGFSLLHFFARPLFLVHSSLFTVHCLHCVPNHIVPKNPPNSGCNRMKTEALLVFFCAVCAPYGVLALHPVVGFGAEGFEEVPHVHHVPAFTEQPVPDNADGGPVQDHLSSGGGKPKVVAQVGPGRPP